MTVASISSEQDFYFYQHLGDTGSCLSPTALFIILKAFVRNSISLLYHFLKSIYLNIQCLLEAAGPVVCNTS